MVTGGPSQLEHQWTFDVTAGSSVAFDVKGYNPSNSEGDDFVFTYHTNATDWTNMVTVTRTTDNGTFQTYTMPGGTSGTVYVRVSGADRTAGRNPLDTFTSTRCFFLSDPWLRAIGLPDAASPDRHKLTFGASLNSTSSIYQHRGFLKARGVSLFTVDRY